MEIEEIPLHLRCDDKHGVEKQRYQRDDFQDGDELFRSYPLVWQDQDKDNKNFPGMLIKSEIGSVDWSRIAEAEDRWVYKPHQGIVRFPCFLPQEALIETTREMNLTTEEFNYTLQHEPVRHSINEDENYSHCHLEFRQRGEVVEEEKPFLKSIGIDFKLIFRRLVSKSICHRRNPDSDWNCPQN